MKLKSKYSLVGIVAAVVAVLVMFLPCLNGVSIMQYVWYPADNETELFKAPFTAGLVRHNGSLQKVSNLASGEEVSEEESESDFDLGSVAQSYVEEYNEYLEELEKKEAEYKEVKAEFEKVAKEVEKTKQTIDVQIERFNRPVNEAARVHDELAAAIDDNKAKLDSNLETIVKSYNKITVLNGVKSGLVKTAKLLSANYTDIDNMVDSAKSAGEKVAANKAAIASCEDAITDAENRIKEIEANIQRIDNEFNDIRTAKENLLARKGEVVAETEDGAEDETDEEEAEDDVIPELRNQFIANVVEIDNAKIDNDIAKLDKVHQEKLDEEAEFKTEMDSLNETIAAKNAEIVALENELNDLANTKDFVAYEAAVILNDISEQISSAKLAIAESNDYVRKSSAFAPVYTNDALSAAIAGVAGLDVEIKDVIELCAKAAENAKANRIIIEDFDVNNVENAEVKEILARNFFDLYYNNEDLVHDDTAPLTYAASAKEISRIIYVDPETRLAIYAYFLDEVTKARDDNSSFVELNKDKDDNEQRGRSNKDNYDAVLASFKSFVDDYEQSRVSSELYELSQEYLELKKSHYEAENIIKANNAEINGTQSEIDSLKNRVAPLMNVELLKDADISTIEEYNAQLKAYLEDLEKEERVASYIIDFEYYAWVKDSNGLQELLQSYESLMNNKQVVDDLILEIEEARKTVTESEEAMAELKAEKGLIECQLTANEYKQMVNDEEVQISWYNYYINNEVSFFLYIMILFVIVVLFGLLVKYWQMNCIANALLALVLVITFFASDLLYVGYLYIRILYCLCALAAIAATVLIYLDGKKNGND